jgi:hypothetical protein
VPKEKGRKGRIRSTMARKIDRQTYESHIEKNRFNEHHEEAREHQY